MSVEFSVVVFVAREDYSEFRKVCVDGDLIPADYDVFEAKIADYIEQTRRQGLALRRFKLDPSKFRDWCTAAGRPTDSSARADYAWSRQVDAEAN